MSFAERELPRTLTRKDRISMNIYIQKLVSISTQNKYLNWYVSLVTTRQNRTHARGYHRHHIFPKSFCETKADKNCEANIVSLTPREHFIAHVLLTKFLSGVYKRKMYGAILFFRDKTSREYEWFWNEATKPENNVMFGKTHLIAARLKISASQKGLSKGKSYEERYGKERAEELKIQRSNTMKGRNNKGEHNPRFDWTIYKLRHISGLEFVGTRTEFRSLPSAPCKTECVSLLAGKRQINGWTLVSALLRT